MSEYVLKTPEAAATFAQGMLIRRLTGEDIRPRKLNMQQAHDIIQAEIAKGTQKKPFKAADNGETAAPRVPYKTMMREAVKAANDAGKAWLANAKPTYVVTSARTGRDLGYPPMLDVCGFAHIEVTDRRTAFARWLAKHQDGDSSWVIIPHQYRKRQELGLVTACESAALKVFSDHSIQGLRFWSKVD